MVIHIAAPVRGLFIKAAVGGHIDLATQNWLDALVSGSLIKVDGPIQDTVICDGQRRELQLVCALDQLIQPAGAIEHRVLRMEMEVDEIRVRHLLKFENRAHGCRDKKRRRAPIV